MKRRSDISILLRMLRELGALAYTMALTIVCGMGGYLSATAIPVFTTVAALAFFGADVGLQYGASALIVIVCALLRGIVHYAEQLSGHYIAFKILAALRGKVFERLRKLAPAKLDDRKKGETVSIVTADIELLETFYAHTIAPVAIAFLTSIVYVLVLTWIHRSVLLYRVGCGDTVMDQRCVSRSGRKIPK